MEKKGLRSLIIGMILLFSLSFISAASKWTVQSALNSWAQAGIFKYVLPFLLVFALVFGILNKAQILGDNKGVQAIIALALGLLSLVGDYFPNFIEKLAPNLATAISVLLCAIILIGLFYKEGSDTKWLIWILVGIGIIAFIAVVSDTFSGYSGIGTNIWDEYGPALVTLLIIGGIIALIIKFGSSGGTTTARTGG